MEQYEAQSSVEIVSYIYIVGHFFMRAGAGRGRDFK